jgi:hypothetical protein
MAIIKPLPNVPLTLSLKNPNAQEVKGQYGIQFKYTLEPNDLIYLPPIAHDEIQKLHAGPGEPFTLTKTLGQGNQAVWKVERIQPSAPNHEDKQERPASVDILNERNYIAQKSITNGKSQVAVMPAAAHDSTLSTPQSKTLLRQLIAAIEVTHAAKIYAQKLGMNIEFTGTDIRALAITGGIQVFKEGVY